jgi:hypothetical protein
MTSKRRDANKIDFIEKHKNFVMKVFDEAETLIREGEEVRKSENVCKLISLARIELKYSPKTYSNDIFFGLLRTYKRSLTR